MPCFWVARVSDAAWKRASHTRSIRVGQPASDTDPIVLLFTCMTRKPHGNQWTAPKSKRHTTYTRVRSWSQYNPVVSNRSQLMQRAHVSESTINATHVCNRSQYDSRACNRFHHYGWWSWSVFLPSREATSKYLFCVFVCVCVCVCVHVHSQQSDSCSGRARGPLGSFFSPAWHHVYPVYPYIKYVCVYMLYVYNDNCDSKDDLTPGRATEPNLGFFTHSADMPFVITFSHTSHVAALNHLFLHQNLHLHTLIYTPSHKRKHTHTHTHK